MLGRQGLTCNLDVVKAFHGAPGESALKAAQRPANADESPFLWFLLQRAGIPAEAVRLLEAEFAALHHGLTRWKNKSALWKQQCSEGRKADKSWE